MRLITQRVKVAENNFNLLEIGSVVIHNLQQYDVYNIQGCTWPFLRISAVSRKDCKLKYFNLTVDQLVIELKGLITLRASYLDKAR